MRDLVFREAQTPYVLCMDSHVFVAPGAIARLIAYFDTHPDTPDLLQGPLLLDNLDGCSTHFKPGWSHGMYGTWGTDTRGASPDSQPFEIPMQGLGLFACRKAAWLGFNPRFTGFGGEEGYIHEKFRRAGGKVLCLPFLGWMHRFVRVGGTPYANRWEDRIHNYYLGWEEAGMATQTITEHFSEFLGKQTFSQVHAIVRERLANPLMFFDAIYYINMDDATERWQSMQARFARLGIAHRVRRWSAVATPESHHIGCALSHRQIIAQAKQQGLTSVLVFEDDAIFLNNFLELASQTLAELKHQRWKLFYFGGHRWEQQYDLAPGCKHLFGQLTKGLTCTQAIAYHQSAFDQLLDELPAQEAPMREWIKRHAGIDQYLGYYSQRYLANPSLVSQPSILGQEDEAHRGLFTLGDEQPASVDEQPTSVGEQQLPDTRHFVPLRVSGFTEEVFTSGEMVLASTHDLQCIYLNPAAALVWRCCDGLQNTQQIITSLQAMYPHTGRAIATDVPQALQLLKHKECIDFVPPQTARPNQRTLGYAGSYISLRCSSKRTGQLLDNLCSDMLVESQPETLNNKYAGVYQLSEPRNPSKGQPIAQLWVDGKLQDEYLDMVDAASRLLDRLTHDLADSCASGIILHAAALAQGSKAIALSGPSQKGKTTLSLWLALHGYTCLSDVMVWIPEGTQLVVGFGRPLRIRKPVPDTLTLHLKEIQHAAIHDTDHEMLIAGRQLNSNTSIKPGQDAPHLQALIFPEYVRDSETSLHSLPSALACSKLMENIVNANNLRVATALREAARITQQVPAYCLRYRDVSEAGEAFTTLAQTMGVAMPG